MASWPPTIGAAGSAARLDITWKTVQRDAGSHTLSVRHCSCLARSWKPRSGSLSSDATQCGSVHRWPPTLGTVFLFVHSAKCGKRTSLDCFAGCTDGRTALTRTLLLLDFVFAQSEEEGERQGRGLEGGRAGAQGPPLFPVRRHGSRSKGLPRVPPPQAEDARSSRYFLHRSVGMSSTEGNLFQSFCSFFFSPKFLTRSEPWPAPSPSPSPSHRQTVWEEPGRPLSVWVLQRLKSFF